jgi:hypothetical protein
MRKEIQGRIAHAKSDEANAVRSWIKANHRAMSEIAREVAPPVSPQYVRAIAFGRAMCESAGRRVERALVARGCPIIKSKGAMQNAS